jgi:3-isopropylmalate/(R)-2-methylmalate dehydratase small subunit
MAEPFVTLKSQAARLAAGNIDTDQIVPARFMRTPRSEGYGNFLFHDLRFDAEGKPISDFPLNAADASHAHILIAGKNFGCGSSREAAVYALFDFGIRCVIAPGFSDNFKANCAKNGLLPVCLSEAELDRLMEDGLVSDLIEVDLRQQTVKRNGRQASFVIDAFAKESLLTGLDEIDMTLRHHSEIGRFQEQHFAQYPWLVIKLQMPSNHSF